MDRGWIFYGFHKSRVDFHGFGMDFLWASWIWDEFPWIWDGSGLIFSMDFMDLGSISMDLGLIFHRFSMDFMDLG